VAVLDSFLGLLFEQSGLLGGEMEAANAASAKRAADNATAKKKLPMMMLLPRCWKLQCSWQYTLLL
jgi:hypothetical protein